MTTVNIVLSGIYKFVEKSVITDETRIYQNQEIPVSKYTKDENIDDYINKINIQCSQRLTGLKPPWQNPNGFLTYQSMLSYVTISFSKDNDNKLICTLSLWQQPIDSRFINLFTEIEIRLPKELGFQSPNTRILIKDTETNIVQDGFFVKSINASIPISQTIDNGGGGGGGGGGNDNGGGDGDDNGGSSRNFNWMKILPYVFIIILFSLVLFIPVIYLLLFNKKK